MKLSHILISTVFLLTSCSSDEPCPTLAIPNTEQAYEEIEEPVPDPVHVNQHELSRFLNSNILPVSATSRSNSITIDTVCGKDDKPIIYVINYGNNNGFILVSAVKTAFPILAFNDTGHYELHNINPAAKFGLENMALNVEESLSLPTDSTARNANMWKTFEKLTSANSRYNVYEDDFDSWSPNLQEMYKQAELIVRAEISHWNEEVIAYLDGGLTDYILGGVNEDEVYNDAEGNCYPQFMTRYMQLSVVRHRIKDLLNNRSPNCLSTNWDQINGFNQSYPRLENGSLAYAGCVPVAIGQIMKYYKWPANYNWDDMPDNLATKTTSDFLYQLAKTGKATYNSDGTGVTASNASNIFKKNGYNTSGIKELNSIGQLSGAGRNPILILGEAYDTATKKKVGHAFIACGHSEFAYIKNLDLFTIVQPKIFQFQSGWEIDHFYAANVYINWGYGGSSNGFYNLNYLTVNGHNYNRNLKYILATPNK